MSLGLRAQNWARSSSNRHRKFDFEHIEPVRNNYIYADFELNWMMTQKGSRAYTSIRPM